MAKYSFEFKKKIVLDYLYGKVGTVAPNRIRRRFNTYIPHQKITTDTTEFKYYEINANDVTYYSYDELKLEIERYIKYYNEHRIKEKLGWISPVQYRLKLLAA
uniref:IS3 family transposase n=1 Tax=Lactobacillus iners TaxID=147802 RepID=UPI00358DBAAF